MNEYLREYLREKETVCWESRVRPFAALGGKYKMKFICELLVAVAVAAVIIVGHIASGSDPKEGLIVLVVGTVVVLAIGAVMYKKLNRKFLYYI